MKHKDKIKEIWKDIPQYEGFYQVSNLGRVKSLKRTKNNVFGTQTKVNEIIRKQGFSTSGYKQVTLSNNGTHNTYQVHLLMAITFLNHKPKGTSKFVCDHIDGNKLNNTLSNLQLITHRVNVSKSCKGTSAYTGVYWNKDRGKWMSRIVIDGKTKFLGRFIKEIDASNAYKKALAGTL